MAEAAVTQTDTDSAPKQPQSPRPRRGMAARHIRAPQLGHAAVPTIASFEVTTTLYTLLMQNLLRRCFEQVQKDMWVLTVKLSSMGFRKEARAANALFIAAVEELEEEMRQEADALESSMDEAGIDGLPDYGDGQNFKLKVTTPLSRRFVTVVQACDGLLQRVDALWLFGALEQHNADDRRYHWRSKVLKLANRMRQNANEMRGALNRGDLREPEAAQEGTDEPSEEALAEGAGDQEPVVAQPDQPEEEHPIATPSAADLGAPDDPPPHTNV